VTMKPKVALSQDFLLQLAKLPSSIHGKVLKWAIKFQADPTAAGINYESIKGARDKNLKSVRVDQDWRGIVFKPDSGDVFVLLYVDHHDDAYRWAENRKLAVNPVTGSMQLVIIETAAQTEPENQTLAHDAPAPQPATAPLFSALEDSELLSLGVPEDLIAEVRRIASEGDLDVLQPRLPVEAYEGLFLLAAGDTVSQILSARETRVDRSVDISDFAAALDAPESRSRFVIISSDEAMTAILNAPLAQWRVFLHPTQMKLAVGDRSGPVRVLGGAGTGKTVLAMHRAKWLAENRTNEGQKVLLTTFTRNLTADIEQNLKGLCDAQPLTRIEVKNLDAWVHGFMRAQKLEHRIVYNRQQDQARQAWASALAIRDTKLDLSDDFYEQELEQVVLAQGITTLDEYRIARRTARTGILTRVKRDAIWPVFEEYRGQLASRNLKEVDDAYREIADIFHAHPNSRPALAAIVIDETQDFGPQALKLLRAMIAPGANDLFFVGDGHQRIYSRHRAAMGKCGIDIRGRSRKLYLNYRTTDEIRRQGVALLEGCEIDDLDDGHDESRRYKSLSHGPAPEVVAVKGFEEAIVEARSFLSRLKAAHAEHEPSLCIITPGEKIREFFSDQFRREGLRCVSITAQSNHTDAHGVVHLATMHRAKGLEFDAVVVIVPSEYLGPPEETLNQRKLLYVALTRAKRAAMLVKVGIDLPTTLISGPN
jgi:superfamily I DNA/RNA helicase